MPSLLDEVTRCVLDLLAKRPDGEDPPQEVLDQVDEIAKLIPQTTDTGVRLVGLLYSARKAALGSTPDALLHFPAIAPLGLAVPELGHLVLLILRSDESLVGDAHDYALRRVMASKAEDRSLVAGAVVAHSDAVNLASLLDTTYRASDPGETLWRGWTLQELGLAQEAGEAMLRYLHEVDPQKARLGDFWGLIPLVASGDPTLAETLFHAMLRLLSATDADNADMMDLAVMFELVDICNSDDLAEELLRFVCAVTYADLGEMAFGLAFQATTLEMQRAAGALALCGYRLTGDLQCADLAVWRLAAAGRNHDAVRLALDAPWQPDDKESREKLLFMYKRVGQVVESEADLREIDRRIVHLGGQSRLSEQLESLSKRLAGYTYEYLSSMWVQRLWNEGQNSSALRKARDITYRERRGILPLSVYVDLAIEIGQFDRALKLASELRALEPTHPVACFKLAQVYKWLARDQEAEQLMRESVNALDDHPVLSPEILEYWASIDAEDARLRCEQALQNPSYIGVHDRLRTLHESLSTAGETR